MIRLWRRSWRYAAALLGRKFEDAADPEIQIEQAIEESKRQHRLLVEQAAAVIGNQRQLQLKLGRTIDQVEGLRNSARQALELSDQARQADDGDAAASYEETAHAFALTLVAQEAEMKDLKTLHDRAIEGAAAAKEAVEHNAFVLRQRLAERARLLSQLQQTKLQEQMNTAIGAMTELAPDADVPSFDRIRDKIEERYARALGRADLGASTIEVRTLNLERARLDSEAGRQLAALRFSLGAGSVDSFTDGMGSAQEPSAGSSPRPASVIQKARGGLESER
jgi:phage shock protein A